MDVRNDRGATVAKLSAGKLANAMGRILGHVQGGIISDSSMGPIGKLSKGTVIGTDGLEKAVYENEILSTLAGTIMYKFSRTAVLDPDGFPVFGLSEDYHKNLDELIAYIVFFSGLWQPHVPPMLYPYIHPGFY